MAKKNFYLHSLRILILYLQLKRFELCRKLFVCCRAGKKLNEVNNKENKLNFTFYLGGKDLSWEIFNWHTFYDSLK